MSKAIIRLEDCAFYIISTSIMFLNVGKIQNAEEHYKHFFSLDEDLLQFCKNCTFYLYKTRALGIGKTLDK